MKACFMGLGYIGLPTAIIAAGSGIQVIGVDVNPKVVEMTNRGIIHIVEPGLQELCSKVMEFGKLKASDVPEESDVYLIVVPTPFKGNHEPDISYVEAATRMVAPFLKKGDLFVIESTSPVGTTEKMANLLYALRPELEGKIYIAYCPERVLPGNVIYELMQNDRVIGGINSENSSVNTGRISFTMSIKGGSKSDRQSISTGSSSSIIGLNCCIISPAASARGGKASSTIGSTASINSLRIGISSSPSGRINISTLRFKPSNMDPRSSYLTFLI